MNNFLNKAHLFKVFIAGWIFTVILFIFLFFLFESKIDGWIFGAIAGVPFGIMFMLMISLQRKSSKFWDYSKVVEELIDKEGLPTKTGVTKRRP
jgi:hypothetical protein